MSITDYDSLLEAVQRTVARSTSTKFNNSFENFLTFAEDRIYDGAGESDQDPLFSRPLRSKVMNKSSTIDFALGVGVVPDDMLEPRSLHPDGQDFGIEYLQPERFAVMSEQLSGSYPQFFTVEGSSMKLTPSFTGTLNVVYYQRFPAITSNNKQGTLLSAHPAIYLSALLFEAYTWMEEPDTALGHLGRFRAQVGGANGSATMVRTGGQALRIRPRQPIS